MNRIYLPALLVGFLSAHAAATEDNISLTVGAGTTTASDTELFYAIDEDQSDALFAAEYDEGDNYLVDVTAPLSLFGLSESAMRAGLRFQSAKTTTDESVGRYDDPASPCNIGPTLGLEDNCWNQATVNMTTEATTLALYLETDIKLADQLILTPRVGIVDMAFDEERTADYLFEGGTSTIVRDNSSFSGIGLMLATDLVKQQEAFFWGGNLEIMQVSDTRKRDIADVELSTPPFSFNRLIAATLKNDITVTTLTIGAHIGKRFDVSGMPLDVVLSLESQSTSNILDTRNTQNDIYPAGALGDKHESFDTLNYGLQLRTQF